MRTNPINLPQPVAKALAVYEQRRLHPWPSAWSELGRDADEREGYALCDTRGAVLAEYWLARGAARAQLRVRNAKPRVLVELELAS